MRPHSTSLGGPTPRHPSAWRPRRGAGGWVLGGLLVLLVAPPTAGLPQSRASAHLRLSAEESLEEGRALLQARRYREAYKRFLHAYETDPNSATGRDGLLLAADALFAEGKEHSLREAAQAYRTYLQRYPTSSPAAYAQFRIALSLAQLMEKPSRDQVTTEEALAELNNVIQRFPTSEYATQARQEKGRVRAHLAEHHFVVGKFYLRTKNPGSARERFQEVLDHYPEYPAQDKLLFYLARAYDADEQPENAALTRERLAEEFPDSPYARRLR